MRKTITSDFIKKDQKKLVLPTPDFIKNILLARSQQIKSGDKREEK